MTDAALPSARDPGWRARHPGLAQLLSHRLFRIGCLLFGLVLLMALLGPLLSSADPTRINARARMLPPGEGHVFGTDNLGRDVWSRVAVGSNVSLLVGFSVALITSIAGTAIGCAAAYFRGLDDALMRVMDALMAFPAILLALAITAALEPGLFNIVLALSVAYVPRTARIARSGALVIRELEYVQAARASGAGAFWIVLRHFVPNVLPALTVQTTFVFSYSVLAEATLSFLGVGPPPPTPTWGTIISEGRDYLIDAWWISLFPGIAITMTVLGLNLIGDGMRDALDPRLRVET